MDLREILVKAAIDLAATLIPVVMAALGLAIKRWGDRIKADTDSKLTAAALSKATTMAYTVVSELSQTIANDLKAANADGKLTDEEKAQIKAHAIEKLKSYVSIDEAKRLVGVDNIDSFLGTLVESAVSETKPGK